MKSKLGETRKSVHFLTPRGDVTNIKIPTKQGNRNSKGAFYKSVHIISADFFIGRSAMSTRTGGASPPGPPLIFIFTPPYKVYKMMRGPLPDRRNLNDACSLYGAMVLWCYGAMVPWCHGAMVQWCHGAMVLWCYGAMVLG